MKTGILIFIAVLTLSLFAQESEKDKLVSWNQHKIKVYVNTGAAKLIAPASFSERWYPGFNIGGAIGYKLSKRMTALVNIGISQFTLNKKAYQRLDNHHNHNRINSGGTKVAYNIYGKMKFNLLPEENRSLLPYVAIGGGLFSVSTHKIVFGDGRNSKNHHETPGATGLGLAVGSGLIIDINHKLHMFVEGKYSVGFTQIKDDFSKSSDTMQLLILKLGVALR